MCGYPTPSSGWEDTERDEAQDVQSTTGERDTIQKPLLDTRLFNHGLSLHHCYGSRVFNVQH